jgi:hypothetical protein
MDALSVAFTFSLKVALRTGLDSAEQLQVNA